MKKFTSSDDSKNFFCDVLYKKIKSEKPVLIENGSFELGFNFFYEKLSNLDKKCVIGLTEKETFVVRQIFGFNKDNIAYNYSEIKKIFAIHDSKQIYIHALFIFVRIISQIRRILNEEIQEDKELNKTLLGELNIPTRIFNILQYHDIYTLGELIKYPRNKVLEMKNMGEKVIKPLDQILETLGVDFISYEEYEKNKNNVQYNYDTPPELRKRRRELKLKILGLEYQKILLQYERIENEKRKMEEEIERLLIENAKEANITR